MGGLEPRRASLLFRVLWARGLAGGGGSWPEAVRPDRAGAGAAAESPGDDGARERERRLAAAAQSLRVERQRIAHDLARMERVALRGPPGTCHAAALVPLCTVGGAPAVLFGVAQRGAFGAAAPVFARAPLDPDATIDAAVGAAATALGLRGSAVEVLGLMSDVPDVGAAPATVVTPVLAWAGELAPATLPHDAAEFDGGLVALSLAQLLAPNSVEVESSGLPVFNRHGGTHRVWGPTAHALHAVLRVVAGADQRFVDVLYRPFQRQQQMFSR